MKPAAYLISAALVAAASQVFQALACMVEVSVLLILALALA